VDGPDRRKPAHFKVREARLGLSGTPVIENDFHIDWSELYHKTNIVQINYNNDDNNKP
jgi:hypothetical protein